MRPDYCITQKSRVGASERVRRESLQQQNSGLIPRLRGSSFIYVAAKQPRVLRKLIYIRDFRVAH
jgi:hypothetical protein